MFKDIVDPSIITRLFSLAALLQRSFQVVSDLQMRLTAWINNNTLANFVLNHYKQYGFYYVKPRSITLNPNNQKITMVFDLKNLFTDRIPL